MDEGNTFQGQLFPLHHTWLNEWDSNKGYKRGKDMVLFQQ